MLETFSGIISLIKLNHLSSDSQYSEKSPKKQIYLINESLYRCKNEIEFLKYCVINRCICTTTGYTILFH